MTNLEKAAAAAVASWERDGARYDTVCQRMDALREALAAHKQAEPVVAPAIAVVTASSDFSATVDWTLNPLPVGTHLYEAPQQAEPVVEPVQAETVPVRADVLAFLQGSAPLNGAWFGEKPDGERGQFWWRKYLPPAPQQAEPAVEAYAVQSAVLIEREACARLCESTTAAWTQHLYNDACMDCAKAIRGQSAPADDASGNPSY